MIRMVTQTNSSVDYVLKISGWSAANKSLPLHSLLHSYGSVQSFTHYPSSQTSFVSMDKKKRGAQIEQITAALPGTCIELANGTQIAKSISTASTCSRVSALLRSSIFIPAVKVHSELKQFGAIQSMRHRQSSDNEFYEWIVSFYESYSIEELLRNKELLEQKLSSGKHHCLIEEAGKNGSLNSNSQYKALFSEPSKPSKKHSVISGLPKEKRSASQPKNLPNLQVFRTLSSEDSLLAQASLLREHLSTLKSSRSRLHKSTSLNRQSNRYMQKDPEAQAKLMVQEYHQKALFEAIPSRRKGDRLPVSPTLIEGSANENSNFLSMTQHSFLSDDQLSFGISTLESEENRQTKMLVHGGLFKQMSCE